MKNRVVLIITAIVLVIAVAVGGTVLWYNANNYVAKVAGEKISKAEYNFFLSSIKAQYEQNVQYTGGDVSAFWNSQIDGKDAKEVAITSALTELHRFKIQLIKASESGVKLDKAEQDSIISSIDQDVKSVGKTEADKQLQEMYKINVSEYKSLVKDLSLVSKYSSQEQEKIQPTDADYKKTYEGMENAEKVTVRHILISTKDAEQKDLTGDKLEAAKKKADEALAKVKAGGNMKELASQYSEDPGSKDDSGQYTFGKGEMMKEFEDWAFSAKPGDVGMVKTDYGYHIMKKPTYDELKEYNKAEISYNKYIEQLDEIRKDPKYDIVKNQKVLDQLSVF